MPESQDHTEVEWQFDVDDLDQVEQWLRDLPASYQIAVTAMDPVEHLDTYLDTTDWRVYQSGYALRWRRSKGRAELTLKEVDAGRDGYVQRREITQQLDDIESESIDHLSGPVGGRVTSIRGRNPTIPLFTAITRRERFRLSRDEQEIGELALDNTTFIGEAFEDQAQLTRVEIETTLELSGFLESFAAELAAVCNARPAPASKFRTGASILGLQPPEPPDVGSVAIDRQSSIAGLATAVLRRHFVELRRREPGTRLGDDIEELHDMRVSARRLRAALALFLTYLPTEFRDFGEELRWVAAALGEVRDLDVQILEIHGWQEHLDTRDAAALDPLFSELNQRRNAARERMLAVLNSERYELFVDAFTNRLKRGVQPDQSELAIVVAPDLIVQKCEKFRHRADRLRTSSPDAAFHRVRIDGKRLRYALEFVSPLYGKVVREFIEQLVGVQDLLGQHQDSIVAIDHLRDMTVESSVSLPPATAFAMGRIADGYASVAGESRTRFLTVYSRMTVKRFARLEQELRRRGRRRRAKQHAEVEKPRAEPGLDLVPVPPDR